MIKILVVVTSMLYCWMLCCWYIQGEKTPVHDAAEDGHLDTLRLFLKDYHANTMVTAVVSQSTDQ